MSINNSTVRIINWKSLLCCLGCVLFVAFAHARGSMIISFLALLIYLSIIAFSQTKDLLQLMLFFLPWSAVLKPTPTMISFASIAMLISLGKLLLQKDLRFRRIHLEVFCLIVGITIVGKIIHSYSFGTNYFMFLIMILFFPIYLEKYKDELCFENAVIFFSFGIISATVVSLILSNNTNMLEFIKVIDYEYIGVRRLCGFYPDPNFYSAQVVTALGGVLILVNKSRMNPIFNSFLVIALVACGLIAISKSFLICLGILTIIWLLCSMREHKGHKKIMMVLLILAISITALLQFGIFSDIINEYLIRFSSVDDASSLTTGRSELWKAYFQYFFDNPLELLIGKGFTSTLDGVPKGSHNTIIQCLYQLGILGTILIAISIFNTLTYIKKGTKISLGYVLLLLATCFSMWMGIDTLFWDDFFLIISFFIVGICYVGDHSCNSKQISIS